MVHQLSRVTDVIIQGRLDSGQEVTSCINCRSRRDAKREAGIGPRERTRLCAQELSTTHVVERY